MAAAQKVQLTPFVGHRMFGSYEGYYMATTGSVFFQGELAAGLTIGLGK